MKIPKELKIIGRTIKVVVDDELTNRNDTYGEAHYRYDKIYLQPRVKGIPRTPQSIQITFLHEIIHFILEGLRESDLRNNEKFVGPFSEVLYQVLKDNKLCFDGEEHGKRQGQGKKAQNKK